MNMLPSTATSACLSGPNLTHHARVDSRQLKGLTIVPRSISLPAKKRAEVGANTERLQQNISSVEGGLLAVTSDGVVGWGWNPQAPATPLHAVLLANDTVVGVGLADRFDLDLVRTRVGPGIPGFVIAWRPKSVESYPLHLTLRDVHGTVLGGLLTLEENSALAETSDPEGSQYEGLIDCVRDGVLLGWARNITQTTRPVTVELYDGHDRIARQIANIYRGDLEVAGKNAGKCAFAFDLPISLLDDQLHSLRVMIVGTSLNVSNGPVQFGRLTASGLFDEVTRLRQEVKRLQSLVEKIVAPNGTVQSEMIRMVSERVSAFAEVQREMVEQELNALRKFAFGAHSTEPSYRAEAPVVQQIDLPTRDFETSRTAQVNKRARQNVSRLTT